MTFGELLKELRLKHNLSIREAARKAGISAPYFSDMERGRKSAPSREVLMKIVDVLGLDKDEAEQLYDCAGWIKTKQNNCMIAQARPKIPSPMIYRSTSWTGTMWQPLFVQPKISMPEKNNGKNL